MLSQVKKEIQEQLYNRCYNKYRAQVQWQSDRYAAFLEQQGQPAMQETSEVEVRKNEPLRILRGTRCAVFLTGQGIAGAETLPAFERFFAAHPQLCAAYAHEDYVNQEGRRHSPWFKPEFSPDTLADSFYVGNVFAVRAGTGFLAAAAGELNPESITAQEARELFLTAVADGLRAGNRQPAALLDEILWHGFAQEEDCDSFCTPSGQNNSLAKLFAEELAASGGFSTEIYAMGVKNALENRRLVSVIIPSKDNPQVLKTCVSSIRERTAGIGFEVIVVDNGSNEENRRLLEQLAETWSFSYCYEPMPFNFSRMCNLGAAQAGCPYLLFLNDDMEVIQEDWLLKLYEKAALPHAGAVGAKLLYPDSALIQHAGVTNLAVGPAHKLLKEDDGSVRYHGRNRGVHDMLAVTAACLMVNRDKFKEIGGFCEQIAVSYNDVELCFALYERGYYNIQRNDVTLFHHESLSRGDDNLSEEKWERLLQEKAALYGRHPGLKGRDPFYSPHLAAHFSDYICGFEYPYEKRDCCTKVRKFRGKEPLAWQNDCLTVTVEHAAKEQKLDLTEEQEMFRLEGWSYVLGGDSCRYRRKLLLIREDGGGYEAQTLDRYRKDVVEILPAQKHVALAGFFARIPCSKMTPGIYHIGVLAQDACSHQKLYRKTEAILVVESKDKV